MGKVKPTKKAAGPRAPAAQVTPQQLYARAQVAIQHQDYDSARTALRKAVKLAPKNVEYVETLGALLAEVGPEEEALEVLRRAVTLSPDVGFEKYLYLGQLLPEPADALAATRKGVQVLQVQHEAARAAGSPEATGLSRVLAGALCSLGEALLGHAQVADAAAREAAEAAGGGDACGSGSGAGTGVAAIAEEVEHLLALAATANPHSPEPGQVLASLRYEQGRPAEALEALKRSMALWHHPESREDEEEGQEPAGGRGGEDEEMGDAEEGGGDGSDSDGSDSESEDDGPSYEFRMECAKLLLELDETTTTAVDVLEGLIEEDDRVPEAWHLLALALYSGHQYGEAAEVLAKGKALLAAAGAGPEDDITHDYAELEAAISEAQALEAQQGQGQAQQG